MALRTPGEPVAPDGLLTMTRRHDDHDVAEVQDGPEHEPAVVVTVPLVNLALNAGTGSYGITGIPVAAATVRREIRLF